MFGSGVVNVSYQFQVLDVRKLYCVYVGGRMLPYSKRVERCSFTLLPPLSKFSSTRRSNPAPLETHICPSSLTSSYSRCTEYSIAASPFTDSFRRNWQVDLPCSCFSLSCSRTSCEVTGMRIHFPRTRMYFCPSANIVSASIALPPLTAVL